MYLLIQKNLFKKLAGMMAILTSLTFLLSLYSLWENAWLYTHGTFATGEIVAFKTQTAHQGKKLVFPVIRYQNQKGSFYEVTSNLAMKYSKIYELGQKYKLVYDPLHPRLMRADSTIGLWGQSMVLTFFTGVNLFLFLIFDYYYFLKREHIKISALET